MIMPSEKEDQFKTSIRDPCFDVEAASSNPLVASLPSVVTKINDSVEVIWKEEVGGDERSGVQSVLQRLSSYAKRDTLRFPKSARAHANFGAALAKAEHWEEATEELQIALGLEPTDHFAGVTLARVYVNKGDYDRAGDLYRKLLQQYPGDDSVLLSLTSLALRANDYLAAEAYLSQVLEISKAAAYPHFLLGMTRLQTRNLHGAISALKSATRVEIRRPEFHHALGVAYAISGDASRAERAFRASLALRPDSPAPVHGLGSVLLEQRHFETAIDILRPHTESHPDDIIAREMLAVAYLETRKYSWARNQFSAGLAAAVSNEDRARFLTNIAAAFLKEGKNVSAEAELNRAIELAPGWSPIPYEHLARIRVLNEQWHVAISILQHVKQLFPDRQSPRRSLAEVYAMIDQHDLGISELRPLYEQGVAEAETFSALGILYEWKDDYDKALLLLAEAYKRSPKTPGIINNLAYAYLMAERPHAARAVLATLPRLIEPYPELMATQGLLRLWEGNRAQGKSLYVRAEQMAISRGNRTLARKLRQKMHLELAKECMRRGDIAAARADIAQGLSVRINGNSFKRRLEDLLCSLERP
jgi:Flp pilus assembly protein TadD